MLAECVCWVAWWFAFAPVASCCGFACGFLGVAWCAYALAVVHVVGAALGDGGDVVDLVSVDVAAGQSELALSVVSL
jgi:hypothetical protein